MCPPDAHRHARRSFRQLVGTPRRPCGTCVKPPSQQLGTTSIRAVRLRSDGRQRAAGYRKNGGAHERPPPNAASPDHSCASWIAHAETQLGEADQDRDHARAGDPLHRNGEDRRTAKPANLPGTPCQEKSGGHPHNAHRLITLHQRRHHGGVAALSICLADG